LAAGFSGVARALSYGIAFGHLVVTALSSFPPGAFPLLKAKVHGAIELVVGLFLIVSPWALRYSGVASARNSLVAVGVAMTALALFTNFDRRRKELPRPPGDRRRWFERKG
jgi:hypothetical protein